MVCRVKDRKVNSPQQKIGRSCKNKYNYFVKVSQVSNTTVYEVNAPNVNTAVFRVAYKVKMMVKDDIVRIDVIGKKPFDKMSKKGIMLTDFKNNKYFARRNAKSDQKQV